MRNFIQSDCAHVEFWKQAQKEINRMNFRKIGSIEKTVHLRVQRFKDLPFFKFMFISKGSQSGFLEIIFFVKFASIEEEVLIQDAFSFKNRLKL